MVLFEIVKPFVFDTKPLNYKLCHFPYYIAVILLNKLQKNIFNYPK